MSELFDFKREYIFGKRQFSSTKLVDAKGNESIEPVFLSVGIEKGKVVLYNAYGVVLEGGMVLPWASFDFAIPIDEKQEKLE